MSNLIITIISIALFAVVAMMAIFYGGSAVENSNIQVAANAIINESQQLLAAARMWSTNNSQTDISGMPADTHIYGKETDPQSFCNVAPATPVGISLLVSSGILTSWPTVGGNIGGIRSGSSVIVGPAPDCYPGSTTFAVGIAKSSGDTGCFRVNGYNGSLWRYLFAYSNGNYLTYDFRINSPDAGNCLNGNGNFMANLSDTSQANHPIVQIAKAINNTLKLIPSAAVMTVIGVPLPPTTANRTGLNWMVVDGSGTPQINYCFITTYSAPYATTNLNEIQCIFGPS